MPSQYPMHGTKYTSTSDGQNQSRDLSPEVCNFPIFEVWYTWQARILVDHNDINRKWKLIFSTVSL